jgi:hypothetical protein
MRNKSGVFSTSYLTNKISSQMKLKIFEALSHYGFLGYDYENNTFVNIEKVIDSFLEYPRHSFRYKTEDFVLFCKEGKDFYSYSIDGGSDNSKIVLELSNKIQSQLQNIQFSFIDLEGDSPDDLRSTIIDLKIKYLFKYNYFGLDYISKFGDQFFLDFPSTKVEFINKELVRIDLTDNIFSPISEITKNLIESYLNSYGISDCEFYSSSPY